MADFNKHHQYQTPPPLSSSGYYTKTDGHVIINAWPYYVPKPKKPASKCFYYIFTIFIIICILLLIFSIIVLPTKPLPLQIKSPSLKTLDYQKSPNPSFSGSISAGILIQNPNFGRIKLESATLSFTYGNATIGASNFVEWNKNFVIGVLHETLIKLDVSMKQSSESMNDQDLNRLSDELSSGILHLKGFVRVNGEVKFFNRFSRKTASQLDCDASINLGTHQLLSFVCN